MKPASLRRTALLAALIVFVAAAPGCAWFNTVDQTQITVQMRSDELLHIAAVPRVLPDGSPAEEPLKKLLQEVAEMAGGYTLIDNVLGGWVPPDQKRVMQERNDLLLVKGRPEVAYLLKARLREDFQQEVPFVHSLPIQSIAVVYQAPPQGRGPAEEIEQAAVTAD